MHATFASARAFDPTTSHAAAERHERTGRAASHRASLGAAVRRNPGRTAPELAQITGLDRYEASRRLPELRAAGEVTNGPERRCTIKGSWQMTWLPAVPVDSTETQQRLW